MMRYALLLLVLVVQATTAAAKPPVALHLGMVQALCEGGAPCSPALIGKGTIDLYTAKQPAPACPKRNDVTENAGGLAKLTGVSKGGAPYTGQVYVEVQYRTTFGADPNGNCELASVQIAVPSVLGNIDCKNGKCKGIIYPFACLPKNCADTPITSELLSVIVYDGPLEDAARKPLGTMGTTIAPASGDAS